MVELFAVKIIFAEQFNGYMYVRKSNLDLKTPNMMLKIHALLGMVAYTHS